MNEFPHQNGTVIRQKLLALREDIEKQSDESADARRPVELDQSRVGRLSRMDALQSQAMAIETGRRRKIELDRITAALKRLDEGDYGFCLRCGEEIPVKRLELDPAASICIDCAKG